MNNTKNSLYTQANLHDIHTAQIAQIPHNSSCTNSGDSLGSNTLLNYGYLNPQKTVEKRFFRQDKIARLLPHSRTAKCLRMPKPLSEFIPVIYSTKLKSAWYKNLTVCSAIWNCPVCAAKITNERRRELSGLVENSELKTSMITFTLQHTKRDSLQRLLSTLQKSITEFKKNRHYKARLDEMHVIGNVQGLEVTYTNGWHPHAHLVLIHNSDFEAQEFEAWSKARWNRIVAKNSGYASKIHGLKYSVGKQKVNDYVAKWGIDNELAGAKNSEGMTPFQLVDLQTAEGDSLFLEYSKAMKGKRQLRYSRGLKSMLRGMRTNSEIAEDVTEFEKVLALLTRSEWKYILTKNARAELLRIAKTGSIPEINNYLEYLFLEVKL